MKSFFPLFAVAAGSAALCCSCVSFGGRPGPDGADADGTGTGAPDKSESLRVPFEPSWTLVDPDNARGLRTEGVRHSFGVARDGRPHAISVASQAYFDGGKFDALTYDASAEGKTLYLTFDVGYDNGWTDLILDTLRDKDVPAAFFCTVGEMREAPRAVARMVAEGHVVGNHTERHLDMSTLSRAEMLWDVKACDDFFRGMFGFSEPFFRFPMGAYSDDALDLVGSLGFTSVFWSIAYDDWDLSRQRGPEYARKIVRERLHPGAVILLHAVSPDNAQALASIIDDARADGYEFRSLREYPRPFAHRGRGHGEPPL